MIDNTNAIASKYLGRKVDGSEKYDNSLLVAIPRELNRTQYDIKNEDLPFIGWDVWHGYEFSALTENGVPLTRVLKLKYNANSKYLVESKSLKLYLNSFNMSRFGKNVEDCLSICKNLIEKDMSEKLETPVEVNFLDNCASRPEIFAQFKNVMNFVDESKLKMSDFKENPELLEVEDALSEQEYFLTFDSLRSNCRVTHQPDFGDAFIYYKSKKHFLEDSLVKYLTSFRSEYHFHEECCEMIFKRLLDRLDAEDKLFVCALYTRRGGIDISPVRSTKNCTVDDAEKLLDLTVLARGCIKQ